MADKYSTKEITPDLINELVSSLKNIRGWGTVEICVQDFLVTQITEKNIKKPIIASTKDVYTIQTNH
ncbi:MAG: DUF2292 domain-containing protein [Candidatus Levybacteria bacterium]|nr:DUF2292 domain-containing protein [Candidatus Levybacteria bacterium]MBP9814800.1 DUF2292 domain-containing protein [Candidatus Levybacteria bacterium]